jgi:hypothetical protein
MELASFLLLSNFAEILSMEIVIVIDSHPNVTEMYQTQRKPETSPCCSRFSMELIYFDMATSCAQASQDPDGHRRPDRNGKGK